MTFTEPLMTLVESHSPPIPHSKIPTSTGNSAKATKASAHIDSKNESLLVILESTSSKYGAISL